MASDADEYVGDGGDESAVQFYFSTRRKRFPYNKDDVGFCVGLFADVYIHIEDDNDDDDPVELDSHRFTLAIPCPNCEEESCEQLFDTLCDQLDRYNIPDYWIRKLRDSLFEDYVTPATNRRRRNCRRPSVNRSASRITVLIRGFMDEIARMPDYDASNPEDVERQQPAAPDAVQALQPVAVGDVEGSCSICLDTTQESDYLKMPCSHAFHRECLLMWLSRDHTCPHCRYEMPVQTP